MLANPANVALACHELRNKQNEQIASRGTGTQTYNELLARRQLSSCSDGHDGSKAGARHSRDVDQTGAACASPLPPPPQVRSQVTTCLAQTRNEFVHRLLRHRAHATMPLYPVAAARQFRR